MKHLKVNKRDREDEDDDRGEMKKTKKQVIEFTESFLMSLIPRVSVPARRKVGRVISLRSLRMWRTWKNRRLK